MGSQGWVTSVCDTWDGCAARAIYRTGAATVQVRQLVDLVPSDTWETSEAGRKFPYLVLRMRNFSRTRYENEFHDYHVASHEVFVPSFIPL